MAIGTETQAVITALKNATDAIAARIEVLIRDKDLSPEEKAEFDSIVSGLQALGADPTNPVP